MKLAVYAIAKNEAKHVARWFEGVKDADEIVVLDTGSTDGTQQALKSLGVKVSSMAFEPFRFDTARNSAMNLVSMDVDYCMFIDLDEVMEPGSITKIKELISNRSHHMYAVRLVFQYDEARKPIVSYLREAIHTRHGFYWKYPVHELLACYENYTYKELPIDVFHEPDNDKPRSSYLELLQKGVEENPDDARMVQYLGREFMYQGQYFDAIMWLKKHIEIETHGPFRSESALYIAQCYFAMDGQLEEALNECEAWHYRAIAEFPSAREPFCALAFLYFQCGQYEPCIGMLRNALRVETQPQVSMIHRDEYYQHWPYHLLAVCYFSLGQMTRAKENIQHAMKLAPKIDGRLANDIATIMGFQNAPRQPIASSAAEAPEQGRLPETGDVGPEEVSGEVSQEQAQVPAQGQDDKEGAHRASQAASPDAD
jgi:Glycosyltransferases involved in cell wall biogenesis